MFLFFIVIVVQSAFGWEFEHGIVGMPDGRPLNIAHRGASGVRPAHSIAAYELAISQGADIIECDLAVSKDQALVCLHDEFLSTVTNVETIEKFADRKKIVNGRLDWFTTDFTLLELKELRLDQERSYRDQSYNGQFQIPSLQEYIDVAKRANRTIGIYPETKKPDWFAERLLVDHGITFSMENTLIAELKKNGLTSSVDACFVQSFSFESLQKLKNQTDLPLIYLFNTGSFNFLPSEDRPRPNDENFSWKSWGFWTEIQKICYGVGPSKSLIAVSSGRKIRFLSDLVEGAHENNLRVHPYTFRNEDEFLNFDYEVDPYEELQVFSDMKIDGYFTDFPKTLSRFLIMQTPSSGTLASLSFLPFVLFTHLQ